MASVAEEDTLLPWIRSIRQVKQAHPEDKSKVLPCVSACYEQFRDSVRYHSDLRFLRICIQLADCSPDPLKIMAELDERGIGHAHAVFYEAYATCLEAKRRFGDANIMYKRGLASQAQPTEKLANSYKSFRDRMDARQMRKQQHARKSCKIAEEGSHRYSHLGDNGTRHMEDCHGDAKLASKPHFVATTLYTGEGFDISFEELRLVYACKKNGSSAREQPEGNLASVQNSLTSQSVSISGKTGSSSFGEETIQIRNFAAEVITGKEKDVEDARHHGLVDPTINTKEALQDILSMFRKPLDIVKKKDISKPSKGLVCVTVAASQPFFQDNEREVASLTGGKQMQPMEFSVFKDDEQDQAQIKSSTKPAAAFPLLHDENKKMTSPLGSLQAQPLELCVYKDDQQEQVDSHSQRTSEGLSHFHHEEKGQINPHHGALKARSSEFSVFKDDELNQEQMEPRRKLAERGRISANLDGVGSSKPLWASKPEQGSESSGFFVFKDEEPSEVQEENAIHMYRDKFNMENQAQCNKFMESRKVQESGFFVFKDEEPTGSTLLEENAGLCCRGIKANTSKRKCPGANKKLAGGIENLLPQSPLY